LEKGWVKRNEDRKVVLSDGKSIPYKLPGNNLAEKVEGLHKDKGAQTPSLFFSVADEAPQTQAQSSNFVQNYSAQRIEDLEREIYLLRKRQVMDSVEIPAPPRLTRAGAKAAKSAEGKTTQASASVPAIIITPDQPEESVAASNKLSKNETQPILPDITSAPTHPYETVAEARYLPPHERLFAAKPAKEKEAAYRTTAPIQSPSIINNIFDKTMKSQCVTLTPEEIMSIAPEVRAKVKEAITPHRVSNDPPAEPTKAQHFATERSRYGYRSAMCSLHCRRISARPSSTSSISSGYRCRFTPRPTRNIVCTRTSC